MKKPSTAPEKDYELIPFQQLKDTFYQILSGKGFPEQKAQRIAEVFAENSLDGVLSHGVNRFPTFLEYVKKGAVKVNTDPVQKSSGSAVEQWDGQLGPGILNALQCTDRAMELARLHGIGCVALANTNHWMRGGTYGWKAAKAGFVFIGWTNTIANMPAWGATDHKLGNNPLVLAVPHKEEAVLLDMAMSQFSYGSLEVRKLSGESLPVPGGFDGEGNLSTDPSKVLESGRIFPTGYWKGAGLSLLLDILSALLSGGLSTAEISRKEVEQSLSQIFIAIDISRLPNHSSIPELVNNIIEDYHSSVQASGANRMRYPGEGSLQHRKTNMENGIPVNKKVWNTIRSLRQV